MKTVINVRLVHQVLSVIHLSGLIIHVMWLCIFNIVIAFCVGHRLVHISLVLGLLHMQRIVLVISVDVCVVCIRDLIYWNRALNGFVFLVQHF